MTLADPLTRMVTHHEFELAYEGLDPDHQGHREALCTLGNGYMATRGALSEATADGVHYPATYVAGLYNRLSSQVGERVIENETIVNLPNWLPITFRPEGGSWSDLATARLVEHNQVLDLRNGVLHRRSKLLDEAGRITVLSERRLVSMSEPHTAALELSITPQNWSGTLEIRSALDGRVSNANVAEDRLLNNVHLLSLSEGGTEGQSIWLEVAMSQSHVHVAQAARLRFRSKQNREIQAKRQIVREPGLVAEEAVLNAVDGQPVVVEKVVQVWTSRDRAQSDPLSAALSGLADAPSFDELLKAHRLSWDHLWRHCRLQVSGAEKNVALLVNLHTFHLLQTLSPHTTDMDVGVPARGLHGEGYRGHVFWDELFVFPLLNHRLPDLTRSLLLYRTRRLPAARRNAREAGLPGVRFPWQSGADGTELTPAQLWNPRSNTWMPDNSRRQHHVSLAVSWNLWQYYQATGDERFLADYGVPVMVGIARFWTGIASRKSEGDGRYDIRGVMGPDEYHDGYPDHPGRGIDNNAYTNVMASWTLHRAVEVRELLCEHHDRHLWERLGVTDDEVATWDRISRGLKVPFHEGMLSQFEGWEELQELDWAGYRRRYGNIGRLDLILQSEGDSTNRYKLAKQADVLMLFYLFSSEELTALLRHLGYDFDAGTIPDTIHYYLNRTAHGSTLSRVVHAWVLARSDRPASWGLFRESLLADLDDTQGGTTAEGVHLGAMAGGLDVLQRCYTGLEIRGNILHFSPRLPLELQSLNFRMKYRGHFLVVTASHKHLEIRAEPCAMAPIQVLIRGSDFTIHAGKTLVVPLSEQD